MMGGTPAKVFAARAELSPLAAGCSPGAGPEWEGSVPEFVPVEQPSKAAWCSRKALGRQFQPRLYFQHLLMRSFEGVFRPRGLAFHFCLPRACALGCILPPLRGWI